MLIVQELLRICSEPVNGENVSNTSIRTSVTSGGDLRPRNGESSEKKTKKSEEKMEGSKYDCLSNLPNLFTFIRCFVVSGILDRLRL